MDEKTVVFEAPVHLGVPDEDDDCAGAEAIARTFGVDRKTVLGWKKKGGAPIYLVGGKYQANYRELWDWIKARASSR
jgi:hypothetical protein